MIYAIRAVGTEFIKFGRANSVGKRLVEIQSTCPFECFIEIVANWPNAAEQAIHSYLEPLLERGEWFREGPLRQAVMLWMTNGEAGLEMLRKETGRPIKASREEKKRTPQALSLAHARVALNPIEARRAEREAYWKARQAVSYPQQSQRTIG